MHFRLDFFMEANNLNTDQTDLGPYCLQYKLPKNSRYEEHRTKVVTSGQRGYKVEQIDVLNV